MTRGRENKQFSCTHPGCHKVFNRRDYLERHATNHLKVKPFICVQCNRHFSRKDLYDNHLTTKRHARVTQEVELASFENKLASGQESLSASFEDTVMPLVSLQQHESSHHHRYQLHQPHQVQSQVPSRPPPAGTASMGTLHFNLSAEELASRRKFADQATDEIILPYEDAMIDSDGILTKGNKMLGGEGSTSAGTDSIASDNPFMLDQPLDDLASDLEIMENSWLLQFGRLDDYDTAKCSNLFGSGLDITEWAPRTEQPPEIMHYSDAGHFCSEIHERLSRDMAMETQNVYRGWREPLEYDPMMCESVSAAESPTSESPDSFTNAKDMADRIDAARSDTSRSETSRLEGPRFDGSQSGTPRSETSRSETSRSEISRSETSRSEASRSETSRQGTMPNHYMWFFDDMFDTEMAKYGYDLCYENQVRLSTARSEQYRLLKGPEDERRDEQLRRRDTFEADLEQACSLLNKSGDSHTASAPVNLDFVQSFPHMLTRPNSQKVAEVQEILGDIPLSCVTRSIHMAMLQIRPFSFLLHPATFNINSVHPVLAAVMTLMGLSLSSDAQDNALAQRAFPQGFLHAYEAMLEFNPSAKKIDLKAMNVLQAYSLLLRYKRLILLGDGRPESLDANTARGYAAAVFLNRVAAAVPSVSKCKRSSSGAKGQQRIWTSISAEGYLFHQGADPEAQWRECVILESLKRVAYFALYTDTEAILRHERADLISAFNMDIHMILPEPLWLARSCREFFYITSGAGVIENVPYLGLIKSLVRFPRSAQLGQSVAEARLVGKLITPMILRIVSAGIVLVTCRITELLPYTSSASSLRDPAASSASSTSSENSYSRSMETYATGEIFGRFDQNVLTRLYRGLDEWYRNFTMKFGAFTEEVMHCDRKACLPLLDMDDPTQCSDVGGAPQYAAIIFLSHCASFIFIHDDMPVVHQVTANLAQWLDSSQPKTAFKQHLYMPLYTNWVRTEEAKWLLRACSLYLAWNNALGGYRLYSRSRFLSSMVYVAAIVMWLNDCANDADASTLSSDVQPLILDDYVFMDDAVEYMNCVYRELCGEPTEPPKRAIGSLLLLAACILYNGKGSRPLVNMIVRLIMTIHPEYTTEQLFSVIERSGEVHKARAERAERRIHPERTFDASPSGGPTNSAYEASADVRSELTAGFR